MKKQVIGFLLMLALIVGCASVQGIAIADKELLRSGYDGVTIGWDE